MTSGRRVWVYWKNEQEDDIEDGSVAEIGAEIMVWAVEAGEGEPSWFKKSFSPVLSVWVTNVGRLRSDKARQSTKKLKSLLSMIQVPTGGRPHCQN